MRTLYLAATVLLGLGCIAAQAQIDAVTATCKDGTAFSGTRRSGACRGHGGVQTFGAAQPAAPAQPAASATPVAPAVVNSPPVAPVPGGGAGQVWVNTTSKVYHCPGDRYYGKTKRGSYMSETAAKAAGDRPDHGKVCS